jgi:outer membrane protein OmpA-like peptidoglycan-associated protein
MRNLWMASVFFLFCVGAADAADCALAERYLAIANDRIKAGVTAEASTNLHNSLAACPTYQAWQQLGELSAQSDERKDKAGAVEAFVAAHELAPDDSSRARSLYQYASLLNREGDPQNAYPLIHDALALSPQDKQIASLAAQIDAQIEKPTKEHLVRGLRDSLYRPLRVASLAPTPQSTAPRPQRPVASGPSVSIPINFESGTSMVDDRTRPNVELLAHALANAAFANRRFVFVGHADVRGGEAYNMPLSRQRAEAIYQAVILFEPSIKGRVAIVGRGSAEPIDPANNEAAYRINRRLQVLLE